VRLVLDELKHVLPLCHRAVGVEDAGRGAGAAEGYFLGAASVRSKLRPGWSGSGKRPLSMRMVGKPQPFPKAA
jgi:hypothetical protein